MDEQSSIHSDSETRKITILRDLLPRRPALFSAIGLIAGLVLAQHRAASAIPGVWMGILLGLAVVVGLALLLVRNPLGIQSLLFLSFALLGYWLLIEQEAELT